MAGSVAPWPAALETESVRHRLCFAVWSWALGLSLDFQVLHLASPSLPSRGRVPERGKGSPSTGQLSYGAISVSVSSQKQMFDGGQCAGVTGCEFPEAEETVPAQKTRQRGQSLSRLGKLLARWGRCFSRRRGWGVSGKVRLGVGVGPRHLLGGAWAPCGSDLGDTALRGLAGFGVLRETSLHKLREQTNPRGPFKQRMGMDCSRASSPVFHGWCPESQDPGVAGTSGNWFCGHRLFGDSRALEALPLGGARPPSDPGAGSCHRGLRDPPWVPLDTAGKAAWAVASQGFIEWL